MSQSRNVFLAPSLLSADFANLANDIRKVEAGGADYLHVDVMDGHFVPNISIGPLVVEAVRKVTQLPLDCHLMITDPDKYIGEFASAGANIITVHVEAALHLHRTIESIKALGCKAGVTLNPGTPLHALGPILPHVDMVLIMSVEPGFGGQSFIPSALQRITQLRSMLQDCRNRDCLVEVDGGIKLSNVKQVFDAGCDVVVSGSGVFETDDPAAALRAMRRTCVAEL